MQDPGPRKWNEAYVLRNEQDEKKEDILIGIAMRKNSIW